MREVDAGKWVTTQWCEVGIDSGGSTSRPNSSTSSFELVTQEAKSPDDDFGLVDIVVTITYSDDAESLELFGGHGPIV